MTKLFEYDTDKFVEYADYGSNYYTVLLINHGLLGSAKNPELGAILEQQGIRLISVARSGYGQSTYVEHESFIDFAKCVEKLLDFLDISKVNILGISAGATHAYAQSAYLKKRVKELFIFSGLPIIYKEDVIAAYENSDEMRAYYEMFRLRSESEIGKTLLESFKPSLPEGFENTDIFKDSMCNDLKGIGQEAKLQSKFWGFDVEKIDQTVHIKHSIDDNIIPYNAVKAGLKYLQAYKLETIQGADHFDEKAFVEFLKYILSILRL